MNFRPKNLPQNECSVGILSRLYFIKEYVAESLSHSKQYIFKNLQKSVMVSCENQWPLLVFKFFRL